MRIFSGTANPELAHGIADYLDMKVSDVEITRFPDNEIFVKIVENIRGRDVFIIQPTCSPPNDNLMELLVMIDAARRASASRITAVMPFFGYARQDRKDQPRVPITAKLVANLLVAAGANRLVTMDLHAQQIQGFFDIPVDHLSAAPVVVGYLQEMGLEDLVVVSPDAGGLKSAHDYSQMLKAGLALVAKQRKGASDVEVISLVGDVEGKTAVMVDDLTTTAGTLCAAAEQLRANGAAEIYAAVSHAVITPKGIDRLQKSCITELVTTDTVPLDETDFRITRLPVAALFGEAIHRIHNNLSVSSLFRI